MVYKKIFFSLYFSSALFSAQETSAPFGGKIDFSFFSDKPRSVEKDYYIWRYLDQNGTKKEYEELFGEVERLTDPLLKKFNAKLNNPEISKIFECKDLSGADLSLKDPSCIKIGLYASKISTLNEEQKKKIIDKTKDVFPDIVEKIEIFNTNNASKLNGKDSFKQGDGADEKDSFDKKNGTNEQENKNIVYENLLKADSELFFWTFSTLGKTFIENNLDKKLPLFFIKKIESSPSMKYFIKKVIFSQNLENLKKSLLNVNPKALIDAQSTFLLGINALQHSEKELAYAFFKEASEKYTYKFDKDNSLFWMYLINKDEKLLKTLADSYDVNIYSLYAQEKLNIFSKEIYTKLNFQENKNLKYDITNPFVARELLNRAKDYNQDQTLQYAKEIYSKHTEPIAALLAEKASGYKQSYFLFPYDEYLVDLEKEKVALMLAITRQESRFIPGSISTSYALGITQFMPFLIKSMSKEMGLEGFDLDDIFDPKNGYKFANIHLDWLKKRLHHPLFIAYAYNGGIGFTKKTLKSGLFQTNGEFEPFLSMEMVPYDESNRYGKKVLGNYIVYKKLLGQEIKFNEIFEMLKSSVHNIDLGK